MIQHQNLKTVFLSVLSDLVSTGASTLLLKRRGLTHGAGLHNEGGASDPGRSFTPEAGPSYLGGEGVLGPRGSPQALLLPPLSFLQSVPLRQPEKKTGRCCPPPPPLTTPPPRLFQPFHLYGRANQWRTRVYCLFRARAAAPPLQPPPPTLQKCSSPSAPLLITSSWVTLNFRCPGRRDTSVNSHNYSSSPLTI